MSIFMFFNNAIPVITGHCSLKLIPFFKPLRVTKQIDTETSKLEHIKHSTYINSDTKKAWKFLRITAKKANLPKKSRKNAKRKIKTDHRYNK